MWTAPGRYGISRVSGKGALLLFSCSISTPGLLFLKAWPEYYIISYHWSITLFPFLHVPFNTEVFLKVLIIHTKNNWLNLMRDPCSKTIVQENSQKYLIDWNYWKIIFTRCPGKLSSLFLCWVRWRLGEFGSKPVCHCWNGTSGPEKSLNIPDCEAYC